MGSVLTPLRRLRRRSLVRRLCQGTVVASLAAGLLAAGTSSANATSTQVSDAATYLAGQLTSGNHYVVSGSPDVGLTENGLLAFAAAGSSYSTDESATATWLDNSSNIGGSGSTLGYVGSSTVYYPGGLANTALAAIVSGGDPTSWAGENLISRLESTEATSGTDAGEFLDPRDSPTYYGYSNPTVQAEAIIAIKHSDPTWSGLSSAVSFLRGQACGNGGFPYEYGESPCSSDSDTTGVVSQALSYVGGSTDNTAAENANHWLTLNQDANGAWTNFCESPYTTLEESANSTALGVEGLLTDPRGSTHFSTEVSDGQTWLAGAQNTDGGLPACTDTGTSDVRATVQGLQGLAGTTYLSLL